MRMSLNPRVMVRVIAAITAILAATATAHAQERCSGPLERAAHVMGTRLTLRICAQTAESAVEVSEAAIAEVRRLEAVLSSWTPASEIGRVNSAAGGAKVAVSQELFSLLVEAGGWVEATGSAFDPAIGSLIDAWDLRGEGGVPAAAELAAARERSGWQKLALCKPHEIVRGPRGWWLDTGAFGKGAALRSVGDLLHRAGVVHAEIDFGGQLLVVGPAREIAVADPRVRDRAVLSLLVADASVSTSSQSERYIEANGKRYGHIVDPRTGKPVAAWGSVTVVASDAMTADVLSTALFVMGPRAAESWARDRSDVGVLILENTKGAPRVTSNAALAPYTIRSK